LPACSHNGQESTKRISYNKREHDWLWHLWERTWEGFSKPRRSNVSYWTQHGTCQIIQSKDKSNHLFSLINVL
jgi:hypothetical protein